MDLSTFELFMYDFNNNIILILFYHSIQTECSTTWNMLFNTLKQIDGFDMEGRETIVD